MVGDFNQKADAPSSELKERFLDAVRKGDETTVSVLLKKHPDAMTWENGARNHALNIAITSDKENMAKWLIARGADIHHGDNDGWTPLIHAVNRNMSGIIDTLVAKGANLESRMISSELTPLLTAAMMGHTACVELLLKAGASVEAVDNRGDNALAIANNHAAAKAAIRTHIDAVEKKKHEEAAAKDAFTAELDGMATKGIDADLRVRRPLTLNIKN